MKNKLKMLFAYFKGLRAKNVFTHLWVEDDEIFDWDMKYQIDGEGLSKTIAPAGFINDILNELVELYMDDFQQYNDYEFDTAWNLEVNIKPFENTLYFTSECKQEQSARYRKQYDFKDLSPKNKDFINKVYEENEGLTKFEIQFSGRWDDGEINRVYFDGRRHDFDDDVEFWELVTELMNKSEGRRWNERNGAEGDLVVWDSVMFLDYTKFDEEYEDTGMNIEVDLDNVKEK
jgi:hypothetical protein